MLFPCSYFTIAWTASLHKCKLGDVGYCSKSTTAAVSVFRVFTALGDIAFSYAGHNMVLEIQATIPSTLEKPSKGPMWKGVIFAHIVVAVC